MGYCEPTVLVEYKREHFIAGDLRLTIDYDLAFYDQTGKQFLSTRFSGQASRVHRARRQNARGTRERAKSPALSVGPARLALLEIRSRLRSLGLGSRQIVASADTR